MTRQEAKEIIGAMSWELYNQEVSDEKTIEALNMAIEALQQEPKTGHWIGIDDYPHEDWECNNCGYVIEAFENPNDFRYCPNCGADMRGDEE